MKFTTKLLDRPGWWAAKDDTHCHCIRIQITSTGRKGRPKQMVDRKRNAMKGEESK